MMAVCVTSTSRLPHSQIGEPYTRFSTPILASSIRLMASCSHHPIRFSRYLRFGLQAVPRYVSMLAKRLSCFISSGTRKLSVTSIQKTSHRRWIWKCCLLLSDDLAMQHANASSSPQKASESTPSSLMIQQKKSLCITKLQPN